MNTRRIFSLGLVTATAVIFLCLAAGTGAAQDNSQKYAIRTPQTVKITPAMRKEAAKRAAERAAAKKAAEEKAAAEKNTASNKK